MKLSKLTRYSSIFENVARGRRVYLAWLYFDCIRCKLIYGTTPENYVSYRMWNLNHFSRKNTISGYRKNKIEKIFNTGIDRSIIGDKVQFNHFFANFIQRNWLYTEGKSKEEIRCFVENNPVIMVKETNLTQGKGIYKIVREDVDDAMILGFMERKILLEEFVNQHSDMAKLNPSSVNTCRIITVKDAKGSVHILAAGLRAGAKGSAVDNFHFGGAMYGLDVSTGTVVSGGITSDGKRNIKVHPSSNYPMLGFVVPNWNTVIETVKNAAGTLSDFRYVGWDVAVTLHGCELIEANLLAGSEVFSLCDRSDFYDIVMQCR